MDRAGYLYIGLGWLVLRGPAGRPGRQLACFAGVLLAYGWMFALARAHDPPGPFTRWLGT